MLAAVTAWCLAAWWADSRLLLSSDGLYATPGIASGVDYPGRWTVFDLLSSPTAVRLVLVAAVGACTVLFVARRRAITVGSLLFVFVFVASLNARAPFAISSAEMYLAVVLFWVGLGAIVGWSNHVVRAVRLQVAVVYLSPVLIRLFHGGSTWIDGSALRVVVDNPDVRRGPLGSVAARLPDAVLSLATWGTLVVESVAALLLIAFAVRPRAIPERLRGTLLRAVAALHASIALVCGLWFFSAVAMIGLVIALRIEVEPRRVAHHWPVPWFVVGCVVVWSFFSISASPAAAAGRQRNVASYVVRGAGITQVWAVFSPNLPRTQRWVEITDDSGGVVVDSRRAHDRIRKLAQNVRARPDGLLAVAWLAALCPKGGLHLDVLAGNPASRAAALVGDCSGEP